ncbi:MAG: YeeE/YedE family protein [Xanthobacteraceae bacterium]|nr:YeeE/YedE family protein [Xanthobacteraceae bacterium]QYK46004.1 MAG: YeeE/YedE family protein [Xanthobacteraceae bacterium]
MQILTLPRIVSLLIGGAVLFFVWQLAAPETRNLSLSLALGAAFGFVLQRSRFCFFCHARDFLEDRDPRGLLSILLALGVGAVGYLVVFGMWVPVPSPERLPPTAHVGPVSWVLALGAFVFGTGMSISGSCISAHIYRLGEGSPTSPFALLGAVIGFGLGFLSWNTLYLATLYNAPAIWLPHWLGYAGTIALTIALLLALALYLLTRGKLVVPAQAKENYGVGSVLCAVFVARWPAWIGGLLVGLISAVAYLRVAPLGVTAELGSLARTATEKIGLLPETLHGLDSFRGCMTAVKTALLSPNGMFVLGIVAASFASALTAGQFTPRLPTLDEAARGVVGGVMMGWGAMVALGCTVGVLLSGIHAGALSGWIFLVFCFGGIVAGLWLRRAVQAPPKKAARRKARA